MLNKEKGGFPAVRPCGPLWGFFRRRVGYLHHQEVLAGLAPLLPVISGWDWTTKKRQAEIAVPFLLLTPQENAIYIKCQISTSATLLSLLPTTRRHSLRLQNTFICKLQNSAAPVGRLWDETSAPVWISAGLLNRANYNNSPDALCMIN